MPRYVVTRLPRLQEDEGRMLVYGTFDTREEAEELVEKECESYWNAGDFMISREAQAEGWSSEGRGRRS